MALRDQDMREWLTKRSLEYLVEHVQYIGLMDEDKRPLADLPRVPIDWEHAELHGSTLEAPIVCWVVPPLFIPRFFGFYRTQVGGPPMDWYEQENVLTERHWLEGFEYRTRPQFNIT